MKDNKVAIFDIAVRCENPRTKFTEGILPEK
jgi:hypothetical protein